MSQHAPLQPTPAEVKNPTDKPVASTLFVKLSLEPKQSLKPEAEATEIDQHDYEHIAAPTKFASGNRSLNDKELIIADEKMKETYHEVSPAIRVTGDEAFVCYFKHNRTPGSRIAQIEPAIAHFHKVFAPDLTPVYYAVYDEKESKYIGVISEHLPGFKPLCDNKNFKKEDLDTKFLDEKKISIATMEGLDSELRALEINDHAFERKLKKLELDEKKLKDEQSICEEAQRSSELSDLLVEVQTKKLELAKEKAQNLKKQKEFFEQMRAKHNLTQVEFQRYRNVKGLARTLSLSYFFMEDDLHRGNLSADGKHIDYDMTLFELTYFYKETILAAWRRPGTLVISREDIINFPNLTVACPYYWPTRFGEKTGTSASSGIKEKQSGSIDWAYIKTYFPDLRRKRNAYPIEVNPIFAELATNPVFIYHKYKMFLKLILCEKELYTKIAEHYIETDALGPDTKTPLIKTIEDMMAKRIKQLTEVLHTMPEFEKFVVDHGEQVKEELKTEFQKQGVTYTSTSIDTRFEIIHQEAKMGVGKQEKEAAAKQLEEKSLPAKWKEFKDELNAAMLEWAKSSDTNLPGVASKMTAFVQTLKADDTKDEIKKLHDELDRFMKIYTPDYSGLAGTASWLATSMRITTNVTYEKLQEWTTKIVTLFPFVKPVVASLKIP